MLVDIDVAPVALCQRRKQSKPESVLQALNDNCSLCVLMHKQFKRKSVNNLTELLIEEQLLSAAIRLLFFSLLL